jgi:glutamate racemase
LKRLDPSCEVFSQACPLLVPLVEEGWEDDPLTNLVIYRYVNPLIQSGQNGIDTLILGCTHYPALRGGIGRVTGPHVSLIDSSEAVAERILSDFASGLLLQGRAPANGQVLRLLTTDVSPSFSEVAIRLMRPHKIPELECVDIG